jgi:hypothetical protein
MQPMRRLNIHSGGPRVFLLGRGTVRNKQQGREVEFRILDNSKKKLISA